MPAIWTPPIDWEYKQVLSAAQANTYLRDNILYLKRKPRDILTFNAVANTAQAITTSFSAVDDTRYTLNLVTSEANEEVFLWVIGLFALTSANQSLYFDWLVDNTVWASSMAVSGISGGCAVENMITNSLGQLIHVRKRVIIPSAGAHTFKLRTKVSSTGTTMTLYTSGFTTEMGAIIE